MGPKMREIPVLSPTKLKILMGGPQNARKCWFWVPKAGKGSQSLNPKPGGPRILENDPASKKGPPNVVFLYKK